MEKKKTENKTRLRISEPIENHEKTTERRGECYVHVLPGEPTLNGPPIRSEKEWNRALNNI